MNKHTIKTSFAVLAAGLAAMGGASAAVVAQYDFETASPNELTSADTSTFSTASDLAGGSATIIDSVTDTFGNPGFSVRIDAFSIDSADDYLTFTITPNAGESIDFTTFSFDMFRDAGANSVTAEVFSSVDSFGAALGSVVYDSSDNDTWVSSGDFDLSGLGTRTTATEFRIDFTKNTGGGGNLDPYLDNITVEGTNAVPEPSAFGLLAGCFGLTWVMLRRRQA